jgi:hypothetical protein
MSLIWEKVLATEIMPKYQNIVKNILRDKESRWHHDYYRDTSTFYDPHVGRARMEVGKHKVNIKKYEASLEKITGALEASKKDPKDPGFKKLSAKDTEALEAEYIELYKLKCQQMVFLDGAESVLQEWIWKQYVQKKRLLLLQSIRNKFMGDGNADYMARAVTWVEEYVERLRKGNGEEPVSPVDEQQTYSRW